MPGKKKSVNLLSADKNEKNMAAFFDMITITLNGDKHECGEGSTVEDIIAMIGANSSKVAVIVNENIVPPEKRRNLELQDNDQVEILAFAGGG